MACLQTFHDSNFQKLFPLSNERTILGRHFDCDIILNDKVVSRHHAHIFLANQEYYIEDLNSSNGTYVNKEKVEGRYRLQENDEIMIGRFVMIFHRYCPVEPEAPSDQQIMTEESGLHKPPIISMIDTEENRSKTLFTINPEAKLAALLQITKDLSSTLVMDQVFNRVFENLFRIFIKADRGFLILHDKKTGALIPKVIKYRRTLDRNKIQLSHTIIKQVIRDKTAILSADAASDSRFDMSESVLNLQIRSVMCAPLIGSSGQGFGAIQIDTAAPRQYFMQDDLNVLVTVANQAAFAIEHAKLHEEALRKQELEGDLALADKIQHDLLPASSPSIKGYDFFSFYQTAYQIGGDYYDYIPLPESKLAILVADVSGKGISAALVMAKLSAEVRCCLADTSSAAEALFRLNAKFIRSGWEDRFITLVMIILDPLQHTATLVNAGHLPPFLRRGNGHVEAIGTTTSGIPLGILPNQRYKALSIPLSPGDSLIVFTDGFNEAMNKNNELFGLERIRYQLQTAASNAAEIGIGLVNSTNQFTGQQTQNDDMCLVCSLRVT